MACAEMTFGGGLRVRSQFRGHCRNDIRWWLTCICLATAEATFGGGQRKLFHVLNLFLPNMEVFLHLNVVPRVSIHIYD